MLNLNCLLYLSEKKDYLDGLWAQSLQGVSQIHLMSLSNEFSIRISDLAERYVKSHADKQAGMERSLLTMHLSTFSFIVYSSKCIEIYYA